MTYLGIDISKSTFVVAYPKEKGYTIREFKNTPAGIHSFMHTLNKDEHHCIMEATGNYGVTLLYMLDKGGYRVSLINPLKTHNFAKTELSVTKTDAEDAKLLTRYGQEKQPPVYKMPTETILILKQKRTVLRQLKKQHTMLTNIQQSLDVLPVQDQLSKNAVKKIIISIEKQIRALEEDMTNITKKEYKHQLELLTSIKGINNKIASALITATGGFTYFDNAKQFSRYLGLCPTIIQSGSSVNVKGHINRNGDSYLRSQLFISAMPTMRFNKACRELYERLRANGKSGKVALIAVANKLIRQAFAVIKSGSPYIDGFVSQPPLLKPATKAIYTSSL